MWPHLPVSPQKFEPGDLVLSETFENFDGNIISVDVGEIYAIHGLAKNRVAILRSYYQEDGRWLKWDNYSMTDGSIFRLKRDRIVRSGIRLRNGSPGIGLTETYVAEANDQVQQQYAEQ